MKREIESGGKIDTQNQERALLSRKQCVSTFAVAEVVGSKQKDIRGVVCSSLESSVVKATRTPREIIKFKFQDARREVASADLWQAKSMLF